MNRLLRRLMTVSSVIALIGGSLLAGAGSASAATNFENQWPDQSGCNSGAVAITSYNMYNSRYQQTQGKLTVMYSSRCNTNWVVVTGYTAGNYYDGKLYNSTNGAVRTVTATGASNAWSRMTDGSSCITPSWAIRDAASGSVEGAATQGTFC